MLYIMPVYTIPRYLSIMFNCVTLTSYLTFLYPSHCIYKQETKVVFIKGMPYAKHLE